MTHKNLKPYFVHVIPEIGYRRMVVERYDGQPVTCDWDTLQALKDEYLGFDACAVEVFPPRGELVDEINRRHFWEVAPERVPSLCRRENPCTCHG